MTESPCVTSYCNVLSDWVSPYLRTGRDNDNSDNNDNNERISRAPFHEKHAQLR